MNLIKVPVIKILGCVCLLAIAFYVNNVTARQTVDKIVAVVNDEVISQSELDRYTTLMTSELIGQSNGGLPPSKELQKQILNHMILDRIQMQMARAYGIEMDSFAVTQAIQEIARQQHLSVDQLKHEVESRNINYNDYRELIRTEMITQSLQSREIGHEITVAKHEVESFLSSAAGQDQSGVEFQLGHILLPLPDAPTPEILKKAQTEAEKLIKELRNGADFSKMAMAKSAGRQALNGGDLGWRTAAELPTLFTNYVQNMQVNEVAGPIRSTGGMHIIKLLDKRVNSKQAQIEAHVLQIVLTPSNKLSSDEAKILITDLHKQIKQGAEFSKVAEQNSHDTRSANKGGDIGWVTADVVPETFANVMRTARSGEVSQPFLTEEGWTIIQVLDKRLQRSSDSSEWDRAMQILTMRKMNEAMEAWTKRIRDEAQVKILLPEA